MADKDRVLECLTEPLPLWESARECREAERESDLAGEPRIGLFVDAQNVRLELLAETIELLSKRGSLRIRRAFGAWPALLQSGDAKVHLEHAVELRQCPRLTNFGKNAADIAMTVDVMDVLSRDELDVFALVSSDSDFTPLVQHLKRAGKEVWGFGLAGAPAALREACSSYQVIERPVARSTEEPESLGAEDVKSDSVVKLRKAFRKVESKDLEGWAALSAIGEVLAERKLTPKQFGASSWSKVFKARPEFEWKKAEGGGGGFARLKACPSELTAGEETLLREVMGKIQGDEGWTRIEVLAKALRCNEAWDFPKHQGKLKKRIRKLRWMEWSEDDPLLVRIPPGSNPAR